MAGKPAFSMAVCGLMGALMLTVMLLGGLIPVATYFAPGLAGFFQIPVRQECARGYGLALHLAVSLLAFFLSPDKESALLFFLLLGYYPLLRSALERVRSRPCRVLLKLLLCNLAICAVYGLLLLVVAPAVFRAELSAMSAWMLAAFLILGNAAFLLYDLLLARLSFLYVWRIRPRLFSGKGSGR